MDSIVTDREKLVSVAVAATLAKRSRTTVYNWLDTGRLTRYIEDGLVKVSATEVLTVPAPFRGRPPRHSTTMSEPNGSLPEKE